MIDIGTQAPAFALLDTARAERKLEEFKGKNTVLAFFPAVFSGICDTEMCSFRDAMADLNTLNAQVVGICVDNPFANKAFAERHNLEFPVLSDYTRETLKAYGVELEDFAGMTGYTVSQRSVFILDGEGTLKFKWIADNPGQLPDLDLIRGELKKLD